MSESIKPRTYAAFLSNPQEAYKARTIALYQHNAEEILKPRIYALYDAGNGNNVSISADISREIINSDSASYRWETLGDGSQFDVHESYKSSNDAKYSKTGIAFNTGDNSPLQKNLPNLNEIWVKFDYFNGTYYRWVQVFFNDNKDIGLHGTDDDTFFNFFGHEFSGIDGINTVLMHISKTTNTAELWINGTKVISGISANLTAPITKVSMSPSGCGGSYSWRTNNWMSNIIISESEIGLNENTNVTVPQAVTDHCDTCRSTSTVETEHTDISRTAITKATIISVIKHCDTSRTTALAEIEHADVLRTVAYARIVVTIHNDISRAIANGTVVHADTYTLKKLAPWRYENPGTTNQMDESIMDYGPRILNIHDETKTKTRTGIACAVSERGKCADMFPIPVDTEMWIRFDAWISPTEIKNNSRNISIGSRSGSHDSYVFFKIPYAECTSIWYADGNDYCWLDNLPDILGLHSYKMHLLAGDAHGLMELYIDNDTTPYISRAGKLMHTQLIDDIGIDTDNDPDDTDISGIVISNIIISNQYIGISEMVKDCVDHGRHAVSHGDTKHCISAEYTNHEDTSLAHYYAESEHGDVLKSVSTIETERADVKRMVLDDGKIPVTVRTDICRKTSGLLSSHVDVCRAVKNHIRTHNDFVVDKARTDRFQYTTHNDFALKKSVIVKYHYDINRNKLMEIKPFREGYQDVQEIDINLNELTLSDSIKLTTTERLYLTEIVRGKLLDYYFQYAIESTSQRGIKTEAQLMFDCDAILYQPIVYNEEETKTPTYAYDESDMAGLTIKEQQLARKAYQEDLLRKQNEWKQARKDRSWALSNMQRIASSLDKQLIWLADNYMTSNDWLGAGQTFSSIISALWGWTNRVPRRQVNVFVRGDKIYVLQRGHETKVVDLNSTAHTVPEIDLEIVRTAWTRTADNDDASNAQGDGDDGNGTEHYFSGTKTNKGMSYEYADGLLMQAQGTDDQGNYTWIIYDYRQVGTYGDDAVQMIYKCEQTQGKGESTVAETYYSYASGWCTATKYVDGEYADSSEYQQSEVARVTEFSGSVSLGSTGSSPGSKAALMVDRSFPVRTDDVATLEKLTQELQWMNRKTKETVKMDIYHCDHLIDFTDRLKFDGNEYFLVSNDVSQTQTELKQTVTMVRWY